MAATKPWPLNHWPARLEPAWPVCRFWGTPAFANCDAGPSENRKEYGSKPASRAKTTEVSPPISRVPLMPMVELLIALGAAVQIDPVFCFWMMYEDPGADRGSPAAPWLCHPTPASIVP